MYTLRQQPSVVLSGHHSQIKTCSFRKVGTWKCNSVSNHVANYSIPSQSSQISASCWKKQIDYAQSAFFVFSIPTRIDFIDWMSQVVIPVEVKLPNQFLKRQNKYCQKRQININIKTIPTGEPSLSPSIKPSQYARKFFESLTSQNFKPRQLFPRWSSGGEYIQIPMTFGMTNIVAPDTPLFAGIPT